jgi:flagellar biosynthetic protein FliR
VLGFPMTLLLGFVCVFLTLSQTGVQFAALTSHVLDNMRLLME